MVHSAGVSRAPRVAVIIASAGRPGVVGDVLEDIGRQTVSPEWVVLSVPDDDSLPVSGVPVETVVVNDRGAAAQRNAGIAAVPEADIAFFFDDDARLRADYLEEALAVFDVRPDVIALTGRVLLDGATGEAISVEAAQQALDLSSADPVRPMHDELPARKTLYGCNFAYRVGSTQQRFDARLPLYSWLEDHDLARRLLREGAIVTAPRCVIVHRGVKSGGRTNHTRLGYSQVMNPAYFVRKGSFPIGLALTELGRLVVKNLVESVVPSATSGWRRERLRGNALAFIDVVRGRFTPERILSL